MQNYIQSDLFWQKQLKNSKNKCIKYQYEEIFYQQFYHFKRILLVNYYNYYQMNIKAIFVLLASLALINCCCYNDPNCNTYDSVGNCIVCAYRSYFKNGVCTVVSNDCATYSTVNGNCLSCWAGLTLSNGACIATSTVTPNNPLCVTFNAAGQCTQCAPRSYLAANGICTAVSDQCATWSTVNGNCLTCYAGYTLSNGACIVSTIVNPPNPLCVTFNTAGQCTQCAPRSYLAANGICTAVSDQCATWSTVNGRCLSCYAGYTLVNGACIVSSSINPNPLCITFNTAGQCTQCAPRSYLAANGICVAVSNLCATWSTVNGRCLSCYSGYTLVNGACVLSSTVNPPNPLCTQFNNIGQCIQCAPRSYLAANGICVAVSDLCATWSTVNGNCLSCYSGYTLSNGVCS